MKHFVDAAKFIDGKGAKVTDRGACIEGAGIGNTYTKDVCTRGIYTKVAYISGICDVNTCI